MSSPIDKYGNAVPPRPMQRFRHDLGIFIFYGILPDGKFRFVCRGVIGDQSLSPRSFAHLIQEKYLIPI
jgi:hypothetical protein